MSFNNYIWGENFALNLARGKVRGTSYVEKFGRNPSVATSIETIWDRGGIYEYLTSAAAVYVYSANAADELTGTGARKITIQGLDTDYNLVQEEVTVNGAASTQTFLRVYRAFITDAGSDGYNRGDIVISTAASGAGTVVAQIGGDGAGLNYIGFGQTMLSLYTVPAGKTAYLTQWTVGCGKQNTDAVATFLARPEGGWNAIDIITVSATTYAKDYKIPLQFTEKTDIEIRAYSTTNNSLVSSTFNLLLIDNTL